MKSNPTCCPVLYNDPKPDFGVTICHSHIHIDFVKVALWGKRVGDPSIKHWKDNKRVKVHFLVGGHWFSIHSIKRCLKHRLVMSDLHHIWYIGYSCCDFVFKQRLEPFPMGFLHTNRRISTTAVFKFYKQPLCVPVFINYYGM